MQAAAEHRSVINTERLAELEALSLKRGAHPSTSREMCVMEAVAYVAGETWSDHPRCACPVIAAFLRNWNDGLSTDADRDRLLKPLVIKLVGSRRGKATESKRAWLAVDWSVRVSTPAWLELAGLKDHAALLRELAPLVDAKTAKAAQAKIDAARDAARDAAWDAARAAAWDAARAAAGDAARAAARAAAGAAAGAAGAAAWDAARAAAGDAARDAARAAAGDAASAAAWDAARAAAWDAARAAAWDAARAAAGDAAWDKLRPTVEMLQQSALELVEAMLQTDAEAA